MEIGALTILGLGFVLGLKHALDADHLIAISTMVSDGKGLLRSSFVGAMWGIGHTAALLAIGSVVIALNIQMPERLGMMLEMGVAVMLVILGVHVLWKVFRGDTLHVHVHTHHGKKHIHPHTHPHTEQHSHGGETHHDKYGDGLLQRILRSVSGQKRSIVIGMVHGMAGSAALMLIVLATITDRLLAVLYIGVFGVGSIGGMILMSAVISLPFSMAASRSVSLNRFIRGTAGVASVCFGLFLAWQIAIEDGLFLPQ